MFCKKCGLQLSEDSNFCPNCGTKVELPGMTTMAEMAEWGELEDSDNEEADENPLKELEKKAKWDGVRDSTSKRSEPIIKIFPTNEENIFLKHDESSLYWYVNQSDDRLSSNYEKLGTMIYKYSYAQFNGKIGFLEKDIDNQFIPIENSFIFSKCHYYGWYKRKDILPHDFGLKRLPENLKKIIDENTQCYFMEHSLWGICVVTDDLRVYSIETSYSAIIISILAIIIGSPFVYLVGGGGNGLSLIAIIGAVVYAICVMSDCMHIEYELKQIYSDLRKGI